MTEHLKAFLKFLALNRNVSPHTVRGKNKATQRVLCGKGLWDFEISAFRIDRDYFQPANRMPL